MSMCAQCFVQMLILMNVGASVIRKWLQYFCTAIQMGFFHSFLSRANKTKTKLVAYVLKNLKRFRRAIELQLNVNNSYEAQTDVENIMRLPKRKQKVNQSPTYACTFSRSIFFFSTPILKSQAACVLFFHFKCNGTESKTATAYR